MKLPYKDVLSVVRYCHEYYWAPLPYDETQQVLLFVRDIFNGGGVVGSKCYPSYYLLENTKDTYLSDVQAAINELEMQYA